ncbi:LysR family transcriptional regulator [Bordetella sp. 15P40C-2]|uniref:LysR family transcriptional regulator n=1 Tax=Bordetella sp. 15P40C-2 TaxID=2572246 RepID=UPI0013254896|nr:LysR family transcriptional regulator [Bordetella sp. 15P40C-2]MVW72324.1 LysR family transcriptional regulator [Bordetella sp. 15P40C-2]
MKISLTQLETFYWVARLKSFHAASRQLHLTQPTVSTRIHELESLIGYRLFERDAKGAALTPKGASFLNKANKLLDLADDVMNDDVVPMRGLLRLGSNESAALSGLAAFLQALSEEYSTLQVELSVDVGSILRGKLCAGGLDFAISTDPGSHPHIRDVLLGASEMIWVAARGKVGRGAILTAKDIAGMPVLTVPAPSALHALNMSWFAGARVSPPRVNSCNSLAVMLRLVMSGTAIAILPRAILERELAEGSIEKIQVDRPVPPLAIYASFPLIGDVRVFERIANMARQALLDARLIQECDGEP